MKAVVNRYMTFEQWRKGTYVEVCRGEIRETSGRAKTSYIVALVRVSGELRLHLELMGGLAMPGDGFQLLGECVCPNWGTADTSEFAPANQCRYRQKAIEAESELDELLSRLQMLDATRIAEEEREYRRSFVSREPA